MSEIKKQDTSLTVVIIEALNARFGEPEKIDKKIPLSECAAQGG